LLPRGFDKKSASKDIAVRGKAFQDNDFAAGGDRVTYRINTRGYSGPFTIAAELLYQSISHRFMLDLQQDSTPLIERFSRYYDGIDKMPAVIHQVKYVTEAEPFLPAWDVNSDFVFISIWK